MVDCVHEWVVFSTAITEGALMVECARCHAFGTVDDPTKEEWKAAFYASEKPYRWWYNHRVTIRGSNRSTPYIQGPKVRPAIVSW